MGYADMIAETLNSSEAVNESVEGETKKFKSAAEFIAESKDKEKEGEEEEGEKVSDGPATFNPDAKEEEESCSVENEEEAEEEETNENSEFKKFISSDSEGSLSNKIDTLIEEAKKREASKDDKPAFYAFLTPEDVKAYESLTNEQQEAVKVALNESVGYYSRQDVLNVVQQVVESDKPSEEERVLAGIPEDMKPVWESLESTMKKSILSQARFYELSNEDVIEHFWRTRKINKPLTESKNFIEEGDIYKTENISDNDAEALLERFKGL
jgi:hypothetical protein